MQVAFSHTLRTLEAAFLLEFCFLGGGQGVGGRARMANLTYIIINDLHVLVRIEALTRQSGPSTDNQQRCLGLDFSLQCRR